MRPLIVFAVLLLLTCYGCRHNSGAAPEADSPAARSGAVSSWPEKESLLLQLNFDQLKALQQEDLPGLSKLPTAEELAGLDKSSPLQIALEPLAEPIFWEALETGLPLLSDHALNVGLQVRALLPTADEDRLRKSLGAFCSQPDSICPPDAEITLHENNLLVSFLLTPEELNEDRNPLKSSRRMAHVSSPARQAFHEAAGIALYSPIDALARTLHVITYLHLLNQNLAPDSAQIRTFFVRNALLQRFLLDHDRTLDLTAILSQEENRLLLDLLQTSAAASPAPAESPDAGLKAAPPLTSPFLDVFWDQGASEGPLPPKWIPAADKPSMLNFSRIFQEMMPWEQAAALLIHPGSSWKTFLSDLRFFEEFVDDDLGGLFEEARAGQVVVGAERPLSIADGPLLEQVSEEELQLYGALLIEPARQSRQTQDLLADLRPLAELDDPEMPSLQIQSAPEGETWTLHHGIAPDDAAKPLERSQSYRFFFSTLLLGSASDFPLNWSSPMETIEIFGYRRNHLRVTRLALGSGPRLAPIEVNDQPSAQTLAALTPPAPSSCQKEARTIAADAGIDLFITHRQEFNPLLLKTLDSFIDLMERCSDQEAAPISGELLGQWLDLGFEARSIDLAELESRSRRLCDGVEIQTACEVVQSFERHR